MTSIRTGTSVACIGLLLAASCADGAEPASLLEGFQRASAVIETRNACQFLDIYVTRTPEQHAQGLMYIRELGEFEGMLFPYEPAVVSFWMKNTYIPLDMLFIRSNGTVARIAENTTPFSEALISSGEPVTGVLEVNGGFAARHHVRAGDRFRVLQ